MNSTNLLPENFIIGAMYLVALYLGFSLIYHDSGINLINEIKTLTTGATLFLAGVTYIIGTITTRLLSVFEYTIMKKLIKFRLVKILFTHKDLLTIEKWDENQEGYKYSTIIQYGAEAVIKRIDSHESIMRITKSLTIVLPIIGILGGILAKNKYSNNWYFIILSTIGFTLAFISLRTHRIAKYHHLGAIDKYFNILKNDSIAPLSKKINDL